MKLSMTYRIRTKGFNHIFNETVRLYRQAVSFFVDVCLKEWNRISVIQGQKIRSGFVESLTVKTKQNPVVPYDFSAKFYKFPSYLRRAVIAEALGKASSYQSNLENWEAAEPEKRGAKPSLPQTGFVYPAMYRSGMFIRTGMYQAAVKVFIRNTWDWVLVDLRKSDVDYIEHHCANYKECVPTLQKRGKKWYLDFVFQTAVQLPEVSIKDTRILAVDLGLNSACTCSVMTSEGAVLGREFLSLPGEYDSLEHAVSHIKHAQKLCARKTPGLWKQAKGINDDIAVKTARFIVDTAIKYDVDCIVMEYLDFAGKKRGSKKQRLHLWRAKYVQSMVTDKAHRNTIRVARVCAWNTSRLAFDGSGRVMRGKEADLPSYSLCRFPTGKQYNCDLNASYNIGSRYYIRELLKTLPATAGQAVAAKVPELAHRSQCTLSSLIKLNAVLAA